MRKKINWPKPEKLYWLLTGETIETNNIPNKEEVEHFWESKKKLYYHKEDTSQSNPKNEYHLIGSKT